MQLHGKVVVFEGDVKDVTAFIRREMPCHQTLSLRDYFKEEVWGYTRRGRKTFATTISVWAKANILCLLYANRNNHIVMLIRAFKT